MMAATAKLGLDSQDVSILDFKVRNLPAARQEVLEHLVAIGKSLKPDLIFCPTLNDVHQDHAVVAQEALRAFKSRTVLGYEMPWNNIVFEANFLIRLEKQDVDRKVEALAQYESQRHRDYMAPTFTEGHARMRGVTIGAPYAEAFTLYRAVI
jgi:LmbE family N-acetylglucosaminyl deacetylase